MILHYHQHQWKKKNIQGFSKKQFTSSSCWLTEAYCFLVSSNVLHRIYYQETSPNLRYLIFEALIKNLSIPIWKLQFMNRISVSIYPCIEHESTAWLITTQFYQIFICYKIPWIKIMNIFGFWHIKRRYKGVVSVHEVSFYLHSEVIWENYCKKSSALFKIRLDLFNIFDVTLWSS